MKAISGKKFCKILESKGWVLKKITGSHHMKVAGISEEEL